jgi:hypothetical protein
VRFALHFAVPVAHCFSHVSSQGLASSSIMRRGTKEALIVDSRATSSRASRKSGVLMSKPVSAGLHKCAGTYKGHISYWYVSVSSKALKLAAHFDCNHGEFK